MPSPLKPRVVELTKLQITVGVLVEVGDLLPCSLDLLFELAGIPLYEVTPSVNMLENKHLVSRSNKLDVTTTRPIQSQSKVKLKPNGDPLGTKVTLLDKFGHGCDVTVGSPVTLRSLAQIIKPWVGPLAEGLRRRKKAEAEGATATTTPMVPPASTTATAPSELTAPAAPVVLVLPEAPVTYLVEEIVEILSPPKPVFPDDLPPADRIPLILAYASSWDAARDKAVEVLAKVEAQQKAISAQVEPIRIGLEALQQPFPAP